MEKIWIKENKFVKLSDEDFMKLDDSLKPLYVKDLQEFRIQEEAEKMEETLKGLIPKSEFDEMKTALGKINSDQEKALELKVQEMQDMVKRMNDRVKNLNKEREREGKSKFELSLIDTKTNKDTDLKDEIEGHKEGNKFRFQVKGTFTGGDVGTITDNIYSQRVPGIGQYAAAKLVLSNFFPVSPIQVNGNGTAVYEDWDKASSTESAAFIAEGATYPESTAKFKTYSITIEKIGDSISMTWEAMNDFQRFIAELSRFLTRNIAAVVNQALWNGTGVTPQFAGIYTRVDAFNAVAYTGPTTTTPDLLDLIKVLSKEIMDGKDDKYAPNFAFVDWDEYLELALEKDTTGRLIYPNGIPSVMGVTIYPTSFVTANTMVIGQREYVECIGDPNNVEIEIGYKSGDWEADKESMKGRVRSCLLIREADKDSFLKVTDIDAALTAITT
jgi:HK97 family phage major capsid protein